jgi:hypothetical protein
MAYRVSCAHATTWFRYKAVSQKLNDTGGVKKRCPGRRGRRKRPGQAATTGGSEFAYRKLDTNGLRAPRISQQRTSLLG